MEQAIETQRRRLLRLVAGLLIAVQFLSVGPVSRSFSDWVCEFIGSILSRAELASRYLVIIQARRMVAGRSARMDFARLLESLPLAFDAPGANVSIADCRARIKALQAVLSDLPRHALRLLRRMEMQSRTACTDQHVPCSAELLSAALRAWSLAERRIERPPDQIERQLDQANALRYTPHLPPVSGREA